MTDQQRKLLEFEAKQKGKLATAIAALLAAHDKAQSNGAKYQLWIAYRRSRGIPAELAQLHPEHFGERV